MDFNTSVSFPSFNPDIEPLNNGPRWRSYLKRFQYFLIAKTELKLEEIEDEIKVGIFLHHVGDRVASIYDNLAKKEDKYDDIVKKLTEYFEPQVNEPFERYNFSEAKQDNDESLDNYVSRLRGLAKNCNFTDIEKEIMNQVIRGCKSNELRRQGLRGALSANEFLKLGRSIEIANNQAKSIEDNSPKHDMVSSIKKNTFQTNGYKQDSCKNCGYTHPRNKCPAFNKTCAKCQRKNHFARMCGQNSKEKSQLERYLNWKNGPKSKSRKMEKVNQVEEEVEEDTDNNDKKSDDDFIDSLFSIDTVNKNDLPRIDIMIFDRKINMQVDTGASINVIDEKTFNSLSLN